ncbi:MAG: hypothetical protein ACP5UN_02775 [Candidatus Micrarchaeia archaeon]
MIRRRNKKEFSLDNIIKEHEEYESRFERNRNNLSFEADKLPRKVPIGVVDKYYSKLSVAAVRLSAELSIGDIIEIGTEEEAIRQRVQSMQINKKDVSIAHEGDDVGIKLKYKVQDGSKIYKLIK